MRTLIYNITWCSLCKIRAAYQSVKHRWFIDNYQSQPRGRVKMKDLNWRSTSKRMVFQVTGLAEMVQTVFEGEERGSKQKTKAWGTSSQGWPAHFTKSYPSETLTVCASPPLFLYVYVCVHLSELCVQEFRCLQRPVKSLDPLSLTSITGSHKGQTWVLGTKLCARKEQQAFLISEIYFL